MKGKEPVDGLRALKEAFGQNTYISKLSHLMERLEFTRMWPIQKYVSTLNGGISHYTQSRRRQSHDFIWTTLYRPGFLYVSFTNHYWSFV